MFDPSTPVRLTPATFKPRVEAGTMRYTPQFGTAHMEDMSTMQPPQIIDGDVVLRIVDSTRGWRELRMFRCGWSGEKAEEEIHVTGKQLDAGVIIGSGAGVTGPPYQRVIALERPSGELISWCGITRRHLCEVPPAFPADADGCPSGVPATAGSPCVRPSRYRSRRSPSRTRTRPPSPAPGKSLNA